MKEALGIPLDEGACFGVSDASRLRPPVHVYRRPLVYVRIRDAGEVDPINRWENEGGLVHE